MNKMGRLLCCFVVLPILLTTNTYALPVSISFHNADLVKFENCYNIQGKFWDLSTYSQYTLVMIPQNHIPANILETGWQPEAPDHNLLNKNEQLWSLAHDNDTTFDDLCIQAFSNDRHCIINSEGLTKLYLPQWYSDIDFSIPTAEISSITNLPKQISESAQVPEPTTFILLGTGLLTLADIGRHRTRKTSAKAGLNKSIADAGLRSSF